MAGKNLPKAPNDKPITGNEAGDGLDGRTPNGDDAANKPSDPKLESGSGRDAGKRPG